MAQSGCNEANTRAKLIDPALQERDWLEIVPEDKRSTHGEIHREQSAVWFLELGQDAPRFVTADPLKGADDD